MLRLPTLALLLLLSLATRGVAQRDTVRYELGVGLDEHGARVVDVKVELRGQRSGVTTLVLPSVWGAQRGLHAAVEGLTGLAGERVEQNRAEDSVHVRRVHHEPGAVLAMRYRLRQDWQGGLNRATYWRVILRDGHALLTGHNALVLPARADSVPCVVELTWRNLPEHWSAESSLGTGTSWTTRTTYGRLRDAVIAAGEMRIHEAAAGGRALRVGLLGGWAFSDGAFVEMARSLMDAEREFWRQAPEPGSYLLLLAPSDTGVGGTALHDAMLTLAPPTAAISALAPVVAHEIFHRWNGRDIRATVDGRFKWLTEGVTDYYADRFARQVGALSPADYLTRVNRMLLGYYTSPVRNVPEVLVEHRYWADPGLMQLPYVRGYALALRLDALLQEGSDGTFTLDEWLRALRAAVGAQGGRLADSLLFEAAPAEARARIRLELSEVLALGETVPLTGRELGACYGYRVVTALVAALGFDPAASAWEGRVRGVEPGSAAQEAGLRDGMPLDAWGWRDVGRTRLAEVVVRDGDERRRISFAPARRERIRVPQFVARARCDVVQ